MNISYMICMNKVNVNISIGFISLVWATIIVHYLYTCICISILSLLVLFWMSHVIKDGMARLIYKSPTGDLYIG